jgi:hypothetical protein
LTAWLALAADDFAKYPAEAALNKPPAAPDVSKGRPRLFRTVLGRAAAEGPNFNGHYRVTHWGCGTNCVEWAVIDLSSGAVWIAPEPASSCWALYAEEPEAVTEWLVSRIDSSLLYLHACEAASPSDHTFDVRLLYQWRSGKAEFIRKESLRQ